MNRNIWLFTMTGTFLVATLFYGCKENQHVEGNSTNPLETGNQEINEPKTLPKVEGLKEDYQNTDRVIWQKPDMVIDLLGGLENKVVADIGAGTGFFSLRLTPKAKKVIAIDIDPRFIDYLDSVKILELPESLQDKLEPRLAKPENPNLGEEEADIILIVNTYMYINDRERYLKILRRSLSSQGKLLIIDFKKKRTPIGPPLDIRIPLFQVEQELYDAGFSKVITNDTALDYQYIMVAEK